MTDRTRGRLQVVLQRLRGVVQRMRRRLGRRGAGGTANQRVEVRRELHRAAIESAPLINDLVLVTRGTGVALAAELAAALPEATIHLLPVARIPPERADALSARVRAARCRTVDERLRHLRTVPQPQLVVEHGLDRTGDRADTFRALLPALADGGTYALARPSPPDRPADSRGRAPDPADQATVPGHRAPDPTDSDGPADPTAGPPHHAPGLGDRAGPGPDPPPWLRELLGTAVDGQPGSAELARCVASSRSLAGGDLVVKRGAHQWMLRDRRATQVLTRRFGSTWGEVVTSKPAGTYRSRADPQTVGEGLRALKPVISVPERHVRRYADAVCHPRKRVGLGDFWLPDTFRNPRMRVLGHRALLSVSPSLARLPDGAAPVVRDVEDPCFLLDSEYPGHFGHVLTDVVSNVWGWHVVRERIPDLRPLVSLPAGQDRVPEFQRQIFAALDVDPERIVYVRPGTAARVRELYACTADWALPGYAAPELAAVWQQIRDRCAAPTAERPRRIFVTRAAREVRTCRNGAEVEEFFRRRGFTVIRPETRDFGEQIALFAGAQVVAGFAGSGMFGAMFAPPTTRVIVLAASSFTALNDYLIKSVVGGPVAYVWSDSEIRHPPSGWTWEAYRSNFVVDLDRFGPDIDRLIG